MNRSLVHTGAVAGLLVALAFVGAQLRGAAHDRFTSAQRYEDVYYLPPPHTLRALSLGWDEALADLVWMRALVYFGDDTVHGGNVDHVFEYGEAMVALDPQFRAAYHWIGVVGVYRPQNVTPEDIERAVAFMQRGARRFPMDGDLAWSIGGALTFELVPLLDDPEAQDDARARGTPWLMTAARLGAAPEWAALSNASLLERIGRTDQAARHLEEMYLSVADPATREQIRARIEQLRDRAEAEAFVAAAQELEERREEDFPYLPVGLYLLVGPRPPIDVDEPIRRGLAPALADE